MSRTLNRLSPRLVASASKPGRYADGGNLYLNVSPNGGRRWVFLFRWQGKPTEMGLGAVRDVPLARAREKAAAARALLADGRSPLEARRLEQSTPTFGDVADQLIESLRPSWKNDKHEAQWIMTLRDYAAPLRPLRVDQIGTEDVLKILRPMWLTVPETASRLRGRVERVLDAARAQGHRSGENPARWRGHLDLILPARKKLTRGHHPAMPHADVPACIARLRATPTISNLALEFTILTAARSGESRLMTWDELDRARAVWIVPAERMKEEREHRVPLCSRALEVIDLAKQAAGHRQSQYVFPGAKPRRPLSDMSLTMALRRVNDRGFTVHGFRSSFRDWAGDETEFARELAEAALSHKVGDDTELAYRRSDALSRRRKLMDQWAFFVNSQDQFTSAQMIAVDTEIHHQVAN
jgi:integrase